MLSRSIGMPDSDNVYVEFPHLHDDIGCRWECDQAQDELISHHVGDPPLPWLIGLAGRHVLAPIRTRGEARKHCPASAAPLLFAQKREQAGHESDE